MPTDNKEKKKVYTNKLEFDKAIKSYSDSLSLYNNYLSAKPYFFDYSDEAKKIRDEKSAQAAVIVNKSGINPTHVQFEDGSKTPYAYFLENPPEEQYMSVFKKPSTKPVYQPAVTKPKLESIKPLGIKPMGTSLEPKLTGDVAVPEIPKTNNKIQNYTGSKALQIQGKPSGYTNQGDNTGRQEFRKGGWLDGLDKNNPIQDNTRVKTTVIPNQALIPKSNLNKNKGTLKSIDRMPEQPLTREEVRKGIKFTTDVAGLFYPPAAIAGAAMDMHQGDKTGALIGLIPGAKDFLTNKNMVTKLATKAFNLGIPNKVVQPSKKVIREAGKYIKGSAEVVEAKDDIGTPIVETVKSNLRNGGWLNNLSTNKFDMGGVLDGLDGIDKGTQVSDATATAKPVVNLNFAVTPAQKQLAAKNKRQAEIDMQVDHPEFYTNPNFLDKKAVKPYSVEDYKKGIKEPGLQTSMDPIDLVGTGVYKGVAKALGAKEVAQGVKGLVSDAVKYAKKKSVKPITSSVNPTSSNILQNSPLSNPQVDLDMDLAQNFQKTLSDAEYNKWMEYMYSAEDAQHISLKEFKQAHKESLERFKNSMVAGGKEHGLFIKDKLAHKVPNNTTIEFDQNGERFYKRSHSPDSYDYKILNYDHSKDQTYLKKATNEQFQKDQGYNISNLTPEERNLVEAYAHGYDKSLNAVARNNSAGTVSTFYQDMGEMLNKGILKNKFKEPTIVRRGIGSDYEIELLDKVTHKPTGVKKLRSELEVGDVFQDKSFISTSTNPTSTWGSSGLSETIEIPGGGIQSLAVPEAATRTHFRGEKEAILPKNLIREIVEVTPNTTSHGQTKYRSKILNPYTITGALLGNTYMNQTKKQNGGWLDNLK